MMRDADRPVRPDGDEMERRLDAAAHDELCDEGGEPLLIVRGHDGLSAEFVGRQVPDARLIEWVAPEPCQFLRLL